MMVDGEQIDVMKQNWDILIILDDCGYDYFKKNYKKELKYDCKLREAKSYFYKTLRWANTNFNNKDCSDVIFICPIFSFDKVVPNHNFFHIENVWRDHWDKKCDTVLPEDITEHFMKLYKKHPDKRFYVHYMTPHYPWIYDKQNSMDEYDINILQMKVRSIFAKLFLFRKMKDIGILGYLFYERDLWIKYGKSLFETMYEKDLINGLKYVNKILDVVKGKKVLITADHGYSFWVKKRFQERILVPYCEVIR